MIPQKIGGTPQGIAGTRYRRAVTSYRIVAYGTPWYGSIQLVEADSTILNEVIVLRYFGLAALWPAQKIGIHTFRNCFLVGK